MALRLQCPGGEVRLVSDDSYASVVRQLLESAQLRALCSVFIVDIVPGETGAAPVMEIVGDLDAAAWRGVDTRLLIGGSRTNLEIAKSAQLARDFIGRGLPCRWLTARDRRGSHVKAVVVDDAVLMGSHNWSLGAMTGQLQDSVLIRSPAFAAMLARRFESQWKRTDDHV